MASLLDLTQQGDVATISDESKLSTIKLMSPRELYQLWERQPWSASAIDFTQDRRDWEEAMGQEERDQLLGSLSAFFVGEERVTTQFCGLVMAYEDQHEEAFLATQLVDEARHAQHFNNFWEQVLRQDGSFEDHLHEARARLGDAYKLLFDDHLGEANQALIDNPGDLEAKIDFVVTYHMIIEGTLALTGQWSQTQWLESTGHLPGYLEGFKNISQDEHRHVAYGTWFLQCKAREDPAFADRIQRRLAEMLPAASGVLIPPGYGPGQPFMRLGQTLDERNEFAFTALNRRLKVIGVSLPAVAA